MTGPAAEQVAAVLTLSGERDQWLKVCLRRERAAFTWGRALGDQEGYERAHTEMAQRWTRISRPVTHGPAHAELEERRWGPAGREAFGAPRAGDFEGRGRPVPAPAPVRTNRGRCPCGRTVITFAGDLSPTCGGCRRAPARCACGALTLRKAT